MIDNQLILPHVIFEDDYLLVLDKPAGWIVNNSKTTGNQPVIEDWLKEKDYPLSKQRDFRSGIVHRLDKETSGVLLVAKTKPVFKELQAQFKNRIVEKKYLALLRGKLVPREGQVEVPLGRLPWNRQRFGVLVGGRNSVTSYRVLKYLKKGESFYTLVEFYPKTGRTHQIRIHAKHLNHPVVSDEFYGGRKECRRERKWCGRLFLHGLEISFFHPVKKMRVNFRSELPAYLERCLAKLEEVKA